MNRNRVVSRLAKAGKLIFTPLAIANCKVWLDANTITGKSDGDTITTWTDLSGNSNSPTQATAAKRPLYKTGIINGLPVVRGDGSDDLLRVTYGAALTQPNTIFIVCQFVNLGTGDYRFVYDGSGTDRHALYRKNQAAHTWWYYAETERDSGDAADTSAHYLVAVFNNGGTCTLRLDGTEISALDPGSQDMAALTLFNDQSGTLAGNVDIAELGVYNAALSSIDITRVENYLSSKYAI